MAKITDGESGGSQASGSGKKTDGIRLLPKSIGKLFDGLRPQKNIRLDRDALRNAGIGVLIQDERWNNLFKTVKKTPLITKNEAEINNYLKEKTRLHIENKIVLAEKQVNVNRILELTMGPEPAGEAAHAEIDGCEARVRAINERTAQIEQAAGEIDQKIYDSSLAMLEDAITYLYRAMKKSQARVAELDRQISEIRESLKERISERETLDASVNDTYFFLHGLLGVNLIDPIDEHYTTDK